MKRIICSVALVVLAASALAPKSAADDPLALVMKHEGHTVSLDLKFSKKNRNTLQHAISFLDWGPNGYATGFVVGDGLVMTAYHAVSGGLSPYKRKQLRFAPDDQLEVRVTVGPA